MTNTATIDRIEVVVARVECDHGHTTETLYISPVIHTDGTVEGLASSDANYCMICEEPAEVVDAEVRVLTDVPDDFARLHGAHRVDA